MNQALKNISKLESCFDIKSKKKSTAEKITKKKSHYKSLKNDNSSNVDSKITDKKTHSKGLKSKDAKGTEKGTTKKTKHKKILLKSATSDNFKFSRKGFILSFTGNLEDFYKLSEEPLGKGTYGCVYKATDKLLKSSRAVKVVSKKKLKNIPRFRQEIDIMKNLDHPNVIKLSETFEDTEKIYLIMELCTGGELFDKIVKRGCFPEPYAAFIMKQIYSVLNYLKYKNICHRDIKPENFLFYDKSPESLIKVIDFGLASYYTDTNVEMKTKAGTPYYVAPQVLTGCYDYKCDLWSAGVLFYILLCGYPPFYGESDQEILYKVKKGNFHFKGKEWSHISVEAKDLIKRCLQLNPNDRISASDALKHPWFKLRKCVMSLDPKMDIHVLENFKNYAMLLKFQKLAMTIVAQQSDDYELQQLKAVFLYLDEEGKGNITKGQLKKGLEHSGLKLPQKLDLLLDQIDSDGNGNIEYTEFLAAALDRRNLSKKLLYSAFRVFDVDNDGEITIAELAHILYNGHKKGSITQQDVNQVKKLIREVDQNNDGKIDFYEFYSMMKMKY